MSIEKLTFYIHVYRIYEKLAIEEASKLNLSPGKGIFLREREIYSTYSKEISKGKEKGISIRGIYKKKKEKKLTLAQVCGIDESWRLASRRHRDRPFRRVW